MDKQPQTISFELAKNLGKFNLNFKPYFKWYKDNIDNKKPILYSDIPPKFCYHKNDEIYPAYQLHEILEMLPPCIYIKFNGNEKIIFHKAPNIIIDEEFYLDFHKNIYDEYYFTYTYALNDKDKPIVIFEEFEDENPAEAAGNLLLWCIENGYVKV